MDCSIVVPVYKGEATLQELLERLYQVLTTLGGQFEVILVNDGSPDRSWEGIETLAKRFPWVVGINLMRNYGQHNALLCGIRQARYETIVTIDDDLQNPPEEIPALLAKLTEGYDVVYGTPEREQHNLWRIVASQMTKLALQNTMGIETARKVSAFRAFRTQLREAFASYQGPTVNMDVLLTWGTNRFTAIPVQHDTRRSGVSNYTFGKLVAHGLNMLTGFSTIPLQLASIVGFVFMFFGMGVLVYVVGRYLTLGYSVAGFPFLASIISIFAGAQLFAIGIIGEYLARMYFHVLNRPPYSLRSKVLHDRES